MAISPEQSPEYEFEWAPSHSAASGKHSVEKPHSRIIDSLSPPLIAMFAVAGTAFLIVLYARILSSQICRLRRRWRRWQRCRRLLRTTASDSGSRSQFQSSPLHPFDSYSDHLLSPYGLDDSAIKMLPILLFSKSKEKDPVTTNRDCAVCLFEFDDNERLRVLPICGHFFHIECIDIWLRSHANCPLCRAAVNFRSDSPFIPMRAARIRPRFDEIVLDNPAATDPDSPILEERGRRFTLKRSYSFGFERSALSEPMMMEMTAATTGSPAWTLRQDHHNQHHHHHHRSFWSKRWSSPFSNGGSARPYYHRSGPNCVIKSPFVRRWGFVPLTAAGVAPADRRSRSLASPPVMWVGRAVGISSSRMRCGDPEALLSPERFNRR